MYAKPHTFFEETDFPITEADFFLPETLCLRFASTQDLPLIEAFLNKRKKTVPCWEYAVDEGRAVIFYDSFNDEVYGFACAQKIMKQNQKPYIEVYEPVSALPWVAMSQMMVAALYLNEETRAAKPYIIYKGQISDSLFYKTFNAREYLDRVNHIKSIVSGKREMFLKLQPMFDGLRQIEMIRASICRRCGG